MYRRYDFGGGSEFGFGFRVGFPPFFEWWHRPLSRRAYLRELKEYLSYLRRRQKEIKEEIEDVENEIGNLEKGA